MNWGSRTPLSATPRLSLGIPTVAAPRRRRVMLLIAASLAACALAQATPALGAEASIGAQSVTEGDAGTTIVNVTVSLDGAATAIETVDVSTLNTGTATAGDDYTAFAASTATFGVGATSATVPLTIVGETVFEADETVVLGLSNPSAGLTLPVVPEGTFTITNDDALPQISVTDSAVFEGNAGTITAAFTVSLTNPSQSTITVERATSSPGGAGSATAGTDYTALGPGTLTFNPGSTAISVLVSVAGDTTFESDEAFSLDLSNVNAGATITDAGGLGTILNDDTAPTLAIDDVSVAEGGTATFTVTRTGLTELTATATYNINDGTATAGDYTDETGTINITAGGATATTTITVATTDDTTFEGDETFTALLSAPTNTTIADASGTATITDTADTPSLAIDDVTVIEGGTATFTVTLSNPSTQAVTARYSTANSTATAPADYTIILSSPANVVTFAANTNANQTLTVTTAADTIDELDETFQVNLTVPTGGAVIDDGQGIGTITDDDTASISIADVTATEGNTGFAPATDATFTLTLSTPSDRPVSVDWITSNGTAVQPADYTSATGTVTFPASTSAAQTLTVAVLGDVIDEDAGTLPSETFDVTLANPTNGATITDGLGAGTIDDDDATPTVSIAGVTVTEGTDPLGVATTPATFAVSLSAPSGLPITAAFATADGTAVAAANPTSSADYTAAPGTVTIPAGQASPTTPLVIAVAADTVDEPTSETFTVTLSAPTNATLGTTVGTGTITDDDNPPIITINDISPLEGDVGLTSPTFTVSLSNQSFQNVTIPYSTANGTATAPADYTMAAPAAQVIVPPMTSAGTIAVDVIGDVLDEEDADTAFVNLGTIVNGTLVGGDAQGQLNITDDDAMPNVSFVPASTETVLEGDSGATGKVLVLQLGAPSGRNVTVNWQTSDIPLFAPNATAGTDYVPVLPPAPETIVVFTPGQTTRNISIGIIGDTNTAEGSESVGLQLNSAVNAILPVNPTKQLLILEDDVPNIAPFASADALTVNRNAPGTVNVRTNDVDANGDALFVPGNTAAVHGIASCQSSGVCAYTPAPGYSGLDAFSYTISDGQATADGTVNINVVNATPIANADALVTGQGVPGAVNVLANDTDPDGGALNIASATGGAHGTVACGAGVCNYVPAAGFVGADQFTYTASDPDGATAVGAVNVTVARGQPLTIAATVNGARARRGLKRMYTIIIRNPNAGPVTLTSASVCLPKGFAYVARSVTGPLKKVPLKRSCGKGKTKLTWVKKVRIRGKGAVALRFKVTVRGPLTTAKITATAKVAAGFAVKPLKAGAPVKVVAK